MPERKSVSGICFFAAFDVRMPREIGSLRPNAIAADSVGPVLLDI
jgi:hypothetical protein